VANFQQFSIDPEANTAPLNVLVDGEAEIAYEWDGENTLGADMEGSQ